ncbi:TPA: Hha/YmoA family nucleoid-associated regulatory protein [Escherichia coli]
MDRCRRRTPRLLRLPPEDTEAFEAAADHRRAELASGRVWDKIPPHVWQYVK